MSLKYPYLNKKQLFSESPKRYLYHYRSLDRMPKNQNHNPRLPELYKIKQTWPEKRSEKELHHVGTASLPGQQMNGASKINQDSLIVDRRLNFYAVADGHGIGGEKVSGFIRVTLLKYLESSIHDARETLQKAIIQTNHDLLGSKIETALAGSTLCCVWLQQNRLIVANVGDSRAVLGRMSGSHWECIELTNDQKPSREDEAMRILRAGGRIAAQQDIYGNQLGPLRVWLKNMNAPGLAMTRSMGDKVGCQAGVIGVPEISEINVGPQDKFIIVASDGVWEYLENKNVVQFCGQLFERGLSAENIAQKLLYNSIDAWKRNSLARDDISCIVILL